MEKKAMIVYHRGLQNPWGSNVYNADVLPGQSIRIWGIYKNLFVPLTYDKTFKVGDRAVYGSYNSTYIGNIVSVGPKTVTIEHGAGDPERTRLGLAEFAWRNYDFDEARIKEENQKESLCI